MRTSTLISFTGASLFPVALSQASTSPKRGLCYVPSTKYPSDDKIWTSGPSNPTWYYNYQAEPSSAFSGNKDLQFVPMLWGASPSDTGTPFQDSVRRQVTNGANISYVLAFNEPNESHDHGGSNLAADLAATRWKAEIEPLRKLGIKVGAPAVTGAASGWTWLDNWFKACDGGCTPDFIPVHWYGNFEGMMSHVGGVTAKWPNLTVWVTEFGFPDQGLEQTQSFFNMSSQSFDRWPNVTHYSYFGAFRSDVSNVGKNAAMLTEKGQLTDIGSWYLGGKATNNVPKGSGASMSRLISCWLGAVVAAVWVLLF